MTPSGDPRLKCVIWDLDGTLWDGVALERRDPALPEPRPEVLATVDLLAERGVVSSIASRTAPSLIAAVRDDPRLRDRFVFPQLGWHDKSVSLRRISEALGVSTDTMVLVDDDPFERAEVAAHVAGARVLPPEDAGQLLSGLPEPDALTEDARHRSRRYRDEDRRSTAAARFDGTRAQFLASCRIRAVARPVVASEADRVSELLERTHRLNNGCDPVPVDVLRERLADPDRWFVPCLELRDRFGDYGLVGVAVVDRADPDGAGRWHVQALATSCRVAGRGAAEMLVDVLIDRARRAGSSALTVSVTPTEANLELRVLLKTCGFGDAAPAPDGSTLLRRRLGDDARPVGPEWADVEDRTGS